MTHVSAAFDQRTYRFRDDDGSETGATWKAAENTVVTQAIGEVFRLRVEVQETAGGSNNNVTVQLEVSVNGGGFTLIDASTSAAQLAASAHVTDQTATTDQLTGGTGSFIAGTVQTGANGSDTSFSGNDHTEHEWCLVLDAGQVSDTDTVTFRVTMDGATTDTATVSPSLTAEAAAAEPVTVATQPATSTVVAQPVSPEVAAVPVSVDATPATLAAAAQPVSIHVGYSAVVLADNPTGYWKFEETSGTTAEDSSGNGFTATVTNGDLNVDGAVGSGVGFNGTDSRVVLGTPNTDSALSGWTWEVWLNTQHNATSNISGIMGEHNHTAERTVLRKSQQAETWTLQVVLSDGGTTSFLNRTVAGLPYDVDMHLVVTVEDAQTTSPIIRVYRDGTEIAMFDDIGTSVVSPYQQQNLGTRDTSGHTYLGWMDEAAFYTYTLSAARVSDHHDAGAGSPGVAVSAQPAALATSGQSVSPQLSATEVAAQPATLASAAQPVTLDLTSASVAAQPAVVAGAALPVTLDLTATSTTALPATATAEASVVLPETSGSPVSISAQPATSSVASQPAVLDLGAATVETVPASTTATASVASVVVSATSTEAAPATVTATAQTATLDLSAVSTAAQPASTTVTASTVSPEVSGAAVTVSAQPATSTATAQTSDPLSAVLVDASPGSVSATAQIAELDLAATSVAAQPATVTTSASPVSPEASTPAVSVQAAPAILVAAAQTIVVAVDPFEMSAQPATVGVAGLAGQVSTTKRERAGKGKAVYQPGPATVYNESDSAAVYIERDPSATYLP